MEKKIFDRSTWTEAEREYNELVMSCAKASSDFQLSNSSTPHAIFLINELVKKSFREVLLFSGSLSLKNICASEKDPEYSLYSNSHLLNTFRQFLSADFVEGAKELKIVVEQDVDGGDDNHPLINIARELHDEKKLIADFSVRKLTSQAVDMLKELNMNNHFFVGDGKSYRFETDIENHKAVANFGDSSTANKLRDIFNTLYTCDSAKVVELNKNAISQFRV